MHISAAECLLLLPPPPPPQMPGLRSGFNVKWLDFIVVVENKTLRASTYYNVSWSCQEDSEEEKT